MLDRLRQYPRAFWTLATIFFISRGAASLVWPYLALVMQQRTEAPLSTVTALISLQAVATMIGTSVSGVLMDRLGRKRPMLFSQVALAAVLWAMSNATGIAAWAALIALYGLLNPVFFVGSYAMVADLVKPEQRQNGFAIVRVMANLAIAVGPAIGGSLMVLSYALPYQLAAIISLALALPFFLLMEESAPRRATPDSRSRFGGYGHVVRDRPFMAFIVSFTLIEVAAALTFVLLPVYTRINFSIPENQYSLLLTTNAVMVVLFQYGMTRLTARRPQLPMVALGALFYAGGLVVFGLARALPHFFVGMIILTIGELVVVPTSNALVAGMAPTDMRARYLGLFALTYNIGAGIGPAAGGQISQWLGPSATWFGGALAALAASAAFLWMARNQREQQDETRKQNLAVEPIHPSTSPEAANSAQSQRLR